MNKFVSTFAVAALALGGLFFSGCTEEDIVGGGNDSGISIIGFNSAADGSVTVAWADTKGTTGSADTLVVLSGSTVVKTVASTSNTATATGLTAGTDYGFYVKNNVGSSTTQTWSPSLHFNNIRLYETADNATGHFSGLQLSTGTALSVSTGATNRLLADVILASDVSIAVPSIWLQGADVEGGGLGNDGRATRFSQAFSVAGGLVNDFYAAGEVSTLIAAQKNSFAIPKNPSLNTDSSIILVFRTVDNHYGRIEILAQKTGVRAGEYYNDDGASGKRYIDVNVTYQPAVGSPYVGRPARKLPSGETAREAIQLSTKVQPNAKN